MSQASDMLDAGLRTLHVHAGESTTYTEAGVAAQTANALELKTRVRGDTIVQDFVYRTSTLTVSDTAWRGAQITDRNSKVWRIEERHDSTGIVAFSASRALERS